MTKDLLEGLLKIKKQEAEKFREAHGSLKGFDSFWAANETELLALHAASEDESEAVAKFSELRTTEDKLKFIAKHGLDKFAELVERGA